MNPEEVFAIGLIQDDRLYKEPVRWVAVRGGYHDWCIYYHTADKTTDWIKRSGDKVRDESIIKDLVECDKEAFEMYRY